MWNLRRGVQDKDGPAGDHGQVASTGRPARAAASRQERSKTLRPWKIVPVLLAALLLGVFTMGFHAQSAHAQASPYIFNNWNTDAVVNNPPTGTDQDGQHYPEFTVSQLTHITTIATYHWNNGAGATPGTISLYQVKGPGSFTLLERPFAATGQSGQGGAPDTNWIATFDFNLNAGTYIVADSGFSTWSNNAKSSYLGFAQVNGTVVAPSSPAAPQQPTAPTTPTAPSPKPLPVPQQPSGCSAQRLCGTLSNCSQPVSDCAAAGATTTPLRYTEVEAVSGSFYAKKPTVCASDTTTQTGSYTLIINTSACPVGTTMTFYVPKLPNGTLGLACFRDNTPRQDYTVQSPSSGFSGGPLTVQGSCQEAP